MSAVIVPLGLLLFFTVLLTVVFTLDCGAQLKVIDGSPFATFVVWLVLSVVISWFTALMLLIKGIAKLQIAIG